MLNWFTRWRALSFGASCLVHLALITGILLAGRWIFPVDPLKLPVLLAEVVAVVDAPSPTEPAPKKPTQKAARESMARLPKPDVTPLPQAADAAIQPPPSAKPANPEPPPPASTSAPTGTSMIAVTEPASSSGAVPAASVSTGNGSAPTTPSVASAPGRDAGATGAITRYARPLGGYQVRPSYPSTALRQGIQGTTLLRVHVLIDGRVGEVIVQESAGHPDLDQAAIDAVRRWHFDPARRGNDPVTMWVLLPVAFQIR